MKGTWLPRMTTYSSKDRSTKNLRVCKWFIPFVVLIGLGTWHYYATHTHPRRCTQSLDSPSHTLTHIHTHPLILTLHTHSLAVILTLVLTLTPTVTCTLTLAVTPILILTLALALTLTLTLKQLSLAHLHSTMNHCINTTWRWYLGGAGRHAAQASQ